QQIPKAGGAAIRTLTSGIPSIPAGVADDPSTFGQQFKDALWLKEVAGNAIGNALIALEIPGGTLGQTTGAPLAFPAACDQTTGATPDTDGDGLLDCWEDGTNWADGKPGISVDGTYSPGRTIANRAVLLC